MSDKIETHELSIEQLESLCRDFQVDNFDGFVSNDKGYIELWLDNNKIKTYDLIPATNDEIKEALKSTDDGYINNLQDKLKEFGLAIVRKKINFSKRFKDSLIFKNNTTNQLTDLDNNVD